MNLTSNDNYTNYQNIFCNQTQQENNINNMSNIDGIQQNKNEIKNHYFDFQNVEKINTENIFATNPFSNFDFRNIFNNTTSQIINNNYNNSNSENPFSGFRITSVIKPVKKVYLTWTINSIKTGFYSRKIFSLA